MSYSVRNSIRYLVAIIIISIAFWGIHYTSDWEGYVRAFYNTDFSRDLAFSFLSNLFVKYGFDFRDLFHFHILLMAILYSSLYKNIGINIIYFALLTLIIGYVGMGNQIRYYVAYPLTLIACFYYYERKFLYSLVCVVLAVMFHYTVFIIYVLFLLMNCIRFWNKKKQFFLIIFLNIVIYFIMYRSNFMVENQYDSYKNVENTSSVMGGLFNLSPLLIPLYYMRKISNADMTNHIIDFLFLLIASSLPLFLLSIYMQIFGSRMMMALLPVYFGYFTLIRQQTSSLYIRRNCIKAIRLTFIYFVFWRFIVPITTGVNGSVMMEMEMMISSYYL